jgi:hypothetical protein
VEELVRHALLRGSPFGPVNGHVVKVGFASTCTGVFIDRDGGAADPDSDAARNLTAWLRGALSRSGVRYLVVQQLAARTTGEVRILVVAGEPVHLVVTKPAGGAEGEDTDASEVVLPPGAATDLTRITIFTRDEALQNGLLTDDTLADLRVAVPLLLSRRGGLGARAGSTPAEWPWCRLDFLLVWRQELGRYGVMFNEVETGSAGQYLHLAEHPVSVLLARAVLVFAGIPAWAAHAAAAEFLAQHCPAALRNKHGTASAAAEAALLPGAYNPLRLKPSRAS